MLCSAALTQTMALYAIGDLQGCLGPAKKLLDKVGFDANRDELWLTGDLVNRGPDSLDGLRFVKKLGARCVLGNHDFHLLKIDAGLEPPPQDGSLDAVMQAPDRVELVDWLRCRPLLITDHRRQLVMTHAGLLPEWDLDTAIRLTDEVAAQLRTDDYRDFLRDIYGDTPARWHSDLKGNDRWRTVVNAVTRMRFCSPDGQMALQYKREPGTQPDGFHPWFELPHRRDPGYTVVFGHWSALGFIRRNGVIGLDTGCVWNGELTAFRLDPGKEKKFSVSCRGKVKRTELS